MSTIREKVCEIERLAAEIDAELPLDATTVVSRGGSNFFDIRTTNIGAPLDRIRKDAATILANLPRGTK